MSAATGVRPTCRGCGAEIEPGTGNRKREWCDDNCRRRHSYAGTCIDCGGPTGFSGTSTPSERCQPCAARVAGAERKHWTREAIIVAIREWAAEYGEPPATRDWNPYSARHHMHDEARARRFEDADGRWPVVSTVFREFGSWRAAIAAAGYEPRPRHGGGENVARRRNQRDPSKCGPSSHAEPESAERSPDPPAGEESP